MSSRSSPVPGVPFMQHPRSTMAEMLWSRSVHPCMASLRIPALLPSVGCRSGGVADSWLLLQATDTLLDQGTKAPYWLVRPLLGPCLMRWHFRGGGHFLVSFVYELAARVVHSVI